MFKILFVPLGIKDAKKLVLADTVIYRIPLINKYLI